MIGASRDRRTRNVAPTALSKRADAEQRAEQPRPSLAEIEGVTGEDDKHEVEGTDQHVLATGDRQHLRRAGSFTHGAQAAARQTQHADTRHGPVVGRRRVDADMRQPDEKLVSASVAQAASTSAGPSTARRTVATSGPPSTLTLSQYPTHRFATVSSPDVRTIAGTSTAHAGRTNVIAATPMAHGPITTATGSRRERGSRGTTEHDSLRGVRSQAHTVWPATMGDRRGQRCDGDDRDQQHDRRQARRRWAVSLEHVHQRPDEQSPLGQDVGEVGDDEENKVAVPQGSAHRTPYG